MSLPSELEDGLREREELLDDALAYGERLERENKRLRRDSNPSLRIELNRVRAEAEEFARGRVPSQRCVKRSRGHLERIGYHFMRLMLTQFRETLLQIEEEER